MKSPPPPRLAAPRKSSTGIIREAEEEEGEKTWNLRPRKGAAAKSGAVVKAEGSVKKERLPGLSEGQGAKRKVMWIACSREETEEDVYAITGGKPKRKPKKRAKTVQKELDNIFPGLHFNGLSVDDVVRGALEPYT